MKFMLQDLPALFIFAWTLPVLILTALLLGAFNAPAPIYAQWEILWCFAPLIVWGIYLVVRYRKGLPRLLAYAVLIGSLALILAGLY